jgi:ATP-dependent Clp protease protease subunit
MGKEDTPEVDLYKKGVHMLMDNIHNESCKEAIEFILKQGYEVNKPNKLQLLICSEGGDMNSAFALIDIIRGSKIPIDTVGLGTIGSAGLLIFMAGSNRTLTPNTSILSHQWSWGAHGKEHELFAQLKEYELTTKRMISHYKKCTGLKEKEIRQYLLPPEDVWLSANDAKKLGICDTVRSTY